MTKSELAAARCRIHPERKAEVWLCGVGTEVCRSCADAFAREIRYSYDRDVALGWIQRQTAILCLGCAYEFALLEDAEREVETFLAMEIA